MAVTNTLYLTRKTNGTYVKYENVTAVSLTGQVAAYSGITGVATTDVITVAGSAFLNGYGITFTSLTGGAGLSTGVKYYVVSASGATFKLATSQGGTAVNFTTNITAGTLLIQTDELLVWSSEFRDVFSSSGAAATVSGANSYNGPGINSPITVSSTVTDVTVTATTAVQSDEAAHAPLRQTFLSRTHWKFTMSSGPSPLYATWADGDIIANNPPNT